MVPNWPLRTVATARRNRNPISLRCWVPTWNTRPVCFTTRQRIWPSSTVSVSGFSQ